MASTPWQEHTKDNKKLKRLRSILFLIGGGTWFLTGCSAVRPDRAVDVATGLISHNLCSAVFVTGLEAEQAYAESLAPRPGMELINWAVHYEIDSARRQVRTTVGGGFESRAVFRDGLGCMVVHERPTESSTGQDDVLDDRASVPALPEIAGPAVVEPADERLRAALDRAFLEPDHPPYRWTKAVVVAHDGRIVAERYAPGCGVNTPLLGYSTTKSVMSALVGILVRQGRLSVEQPAPVAAWSHPGDPRHAITIDNLLRMTSGLSLDESDSPLSPVARMLYLERDMAGYAESTGLEAKPGSTWNYTSGNTLIVSRIIRDAVGGQATGVLRFADDELFAPLGMRNVTLEFDATGTPVGSTYMLAPARDWVRFAMLYLNDGVVVGRRILPEGWVRYSTTPALDTGYGAGFWTNRVGGHIPWSSALWSIPGAPRDSFYARGLLGQYVVVVPSERLVVARFGVSHGPGADIEGVGHLVADAIDAVKS
jgi:CubicO group peptidase (beta-lactamase class C family)